MRFLKIDKEGVWFEGIFTHRNSDGTIKVGKILCKLDDYSKLGYEILTSNIENERFKDLIDKGVLKTVSLEYQN